MIDMKSILAFLVVCLYLLPNTGWAASKYHSFRLRTKVIHNGKVRYENRTHTYNFKIRVVSDDDGYKREVLVAGKYPFIEAVYRERYAVKVYNPLPVRVAVNLSIDGLNSINGQPCTPESGRKWLIEPRGYITVEGWQVSRTSLRRFFFTSKEKSYADWQSNKWGTDLTVKCGMISAAYFWNRRELERYFQRHPIIERSYDEEDGPLTSQKSTKRSMESDAGTGMGEKEYNPVYSVAFDYDMGMYRSREAVKIYYDFDIFSSRRALDKYKERSVRSYDDDDEEEEDGDFADEQDLRRPVEDEDYDE
jgi:hypothetical protein